MTEKKIENFIDSNDEDLNKDYLDKLLEKLKTVKSENNKIQLWMIILVVIYYGLDFQLISDLNYGPLNIKSDHEFIRLFIPPLFTYFLLQFATLNAQRGALIKSVRVFGRKIYKLENNIKEKSFYSNEFLHLIMPFSLAEETQNKYLGDNNWFTTILSIPLFLIFISPLIFEYYAIKNLILNNEANLLNITIIGFTIWLVIVIIGYYFKLIRLSMREVKQDFKRTPTPGANNG